MRWTVGAIAGERILVTGGAGFLGRYCCSLLESTDPNSIIVPRSEQYDLRQRQAIDQLFADTKPTMVIHLAAVVGGIGANRANPGRYFYDNAIMGLELLEVSRLAKITKFVGVGTICSYPKYASIPFKEDDLWSGYPEETNAPYGLAKKMLLVQAQAYRAQYGLDAITLLPVNLYGPGDNFDPETSHVIPALIKKALTAKEEQSPFLEAWGTGNASREFLFASDAARAIILAADHYSGADPVNLGSGQEITIAKLTELICELCGYTGSIQWDSSKPDGQPRRCLDVSRAEQLFNFKAEVDLRSGLEQTIDWYTGKL